MCKVVVNEKGSYQALLIALKAYPLPKSASISDEEIEAQIKEMAEGWE